MYWNHSWQRVRDQVMSLTDKPFKRALFGKIASSMMTLGRQVTAAFESTVWHSVC